MKIGDIVTPDDGGDQLHCGSGFYPDAVVVAIEPLVLVSQSTEMMWWATIQDRTFKVVGTASDELLTRCQKRLA